MTETQKQFLLLLAYLYLQNGKWPKALVLLRALEAFFPADPHVALNLAYAQLGAGNFEEALQRAEACTGSGAPEPLRLAALLIRSQSLWGLGREEEGRHGFAVYLAAQRKTP